MALLQRRCALVALAVLVGVGALGGVARGARLEPEGGGEVAAQRPTGAEELVGNTAEEVALSVEAETEECSLKKAWRSSPFKVWTSGDDTPRLSADHASVRVKVTYSSRCAGGGSAFEADFAEKAAVRAVVVTRAVPDECPEGTALDEPADFTEDVDLPLPDGARVSDLGPGARLYLALPPDSDYELWLLA